VQRSPLPLEYRRVGLAPERRSKLAIIALILSVVFTPCPGLPILWRIVPRNVYYRLDEYFFVYGPITAFAISVVAAIRIYRSDDELRGLSVAVAAAMISFASITCAGVLWTMSRGGGIYFG
jgi:hypothetical protein